MADFRIKLKETEQLLRDKGLNDGGEIQTYVDNAVIRFSDPYVPFKSGTMQKSARTASEIGHGIVRYKTPYARRQYYSTREPKGLRGPKWFERMKLARMNDILNGVKNRLKGR